MHIITGKRMLEVKVKNRISQMFCKHETVRGEQCSRLGMTRISGQDIVVVCVKCGKIISKCSTIY